MKSIFLIVLSVIFLSCETTFVEKSLCGKNLKDIKDLAGKYQIAEYGLELGMELKHVAKGTYDIFHDGDSHATYQYKTCIINGMIIAEININSGDGEVFDTLQTLEVTAHSLRLSTLMFDENELKARNIKYEVSFDEIMGQQTKSLMIENANTPLDKLTDIMFPSVSTTATYTKL